MVTSSTKHEMHLPEINIRLIRQGKKTIETRLNDKKRKKIKVGDTIKFTNKSKLTEKVLVRVTERLEYPTFSELFLNHPAFQFGGKDMEELMTIYKYYTIEDEKTFGALGIRFEKIN